MPNCPVTNSGDYVPLKEYVRDIIHSESALRKAQLESTERALLLAKEEIDRRLHDMNALRDQINQERSNSVPRDWFERLHKITTDRIDVLERRASEESGKVSGAETKMQSKMLVFGIVVTLLNLVIAAVAVFIALHRG